MVVILHQPTITFFSRQADIDKNGIVRAINCVSHKDTVFNSTFSYMRKLPPPIFTNQSVRYDLSHLPNIAAM